MTWLGSPRLAGGRTHPQVQARRCLWLLGASPHVRCALQLAALLIVRRNALHLWRAQGVGRVVIS